MQRDGWDVAGDVLEGRAGGEYDERTFLYFLGVERSSADRADHGLWLLLVSVEPNLDESARMDAITTARVFAELRAVLRETDVIGWYEQDRIAGAILSAPANPDVPEVTHIIKTRVDETLRRRLPALAARGMRVKVIPLRRNSREN